MERGINLRAELLMQLPDQGVRERYLTIRASASVDPTEQRTASVNKPLGIRNIRGRERAGTFVRRLA